MTITIHGKHATAWVDYLTTDGDADTSALLVPCSRYGHTSRECAWWAVAAEAVYIAANGEDDDPEDALDSLMGLVVNDHSDIAELVYEHWFAIPTSIRACIGSRSDVKELLA